jgi:lipopolysaccharide transport system permease protein
MSSAGGSIAVAKPQVLLKDGVLVVRAEVANQSTETLRSADGWAAGYHLFDDPAGTLVVDGDRFPLELAPGGTQPFEMTIAVPPEPGEYSVRISPVLEGVAWFYERGWPFLRIDVDVRRDGARILRHWGITDRAAVRRRLALRRLSRAIVWPVSTCWRNRNLIRTLVRRDILSRYSGSFGGAFWTIINPLLLMLTYLFVFGAVLRSRIPNDPSPVSFALYLLCGMLPWLAFSEAAGRAPGILLEHRNFIKKLLFPVEILPVNLAVTGLVTEFFGLVLFFLALFVFRGRLPLTAFYIPLIAIPQFLFTAGVCWFLAALGAFVRDLAQINGFLLTVWFFITPICYPEQSMPAAAVTLLDKNPFYIFVHAYRNVLLDGVTPDWGQLGWLTLASAFVFIAGYAWFYKLRRSFADLL